MPALGSLAKTGAIVPVAVVFALQGIPATIANMMHVLVSLAKTMVIVPVVIAFALRVILAPIVNIQPQEM